ncbi:pimeloyl-CoA dehydrogenase small subunit [Pollutimonas subterranea]|uniref:Pimeloyl-CoA dehydrogenase small subunit n=1 Tax=Pollutimonas subterranea TaxID=2045210 RepID=A0A2N4U6P6_9BURK|nr:acyl-CoA dehydrogenase family protein [Pollutimonas subterranea]PLC50694.1 pimeloyl-CoA dehydrogenase small subunit [Pollutimonas subterranea]
MDFSYTEEQLALEDTLRRFIAKEYSFEQRRGYMRSADGFSRAAWRTYAELGILALPFPDEFGGLNGTALDTMLVMRALGTGLTLEPYLGTVVLCGGILKAHAYPKQQASLIPAIGDGSLMLALAHYEPQSRYDESTVSARAVRKGGQWQLDGHKAVVQGAASAGQFLVSARTNGHDGADALSLFLVAATTPGLSFRYYECHDGTRAADIVFDQVLLDDDALLGREAHALPAIMQGIALANVAMSAEAAGIMQALNAATLDYLKTRKQFDVPLASFQALQHRMADMAIAAEQSDSMALLAAIEMQNPDAGVRLQKASGAKAFVTQKARLVGQEAIQMHGGIGVTDELMVGHYFKRLAVISASFGDMDFHLRRYSDIIRAA